MTMSWRHIWQIALRDLRIEGRAGEVLLLIVPFGAALLVLFPMAVGTDRPLLSQIGSGLFWALVLVFGILIALRQSSLETEAHRDLVALLGVDPASSFFGKVTATAILLVLELVLAPLTIVLYRPASVDGWGWLAATGLLFAAALSLLATLAGSVVTGLRTRSALVPLVVVPLSVPMLLAATQTTEALRLGRSIVSWTLLQILMILLLAVLGVLTARPLEEASR